MLECLGHHGLGWCWHRGWHGHDIHHHEEDGNGRYYESGCGQQQPLPSAAAADTGEGKNTMPPSSMSPPSKKSPTVLRRRHPSRPLSATAVIRCCRRHRRKLWEVYDKPLKLCVQVEREAENIVHCTPSLCLQLTGPRQQDHVPWAKFPKSESNCPVPECGHALTMPLQSRESINSGDDRLRRAVAANGGDGVFEPVEMKVGCYCYSQNCFGGEAGIGCCRQRG